MATVSPPRTEVLPGIWLDGRRAVFIESLQLLAVADLHWGYAVSHRAHGNLLPIWGDEEITLRLDSLIQDYRPRELLWLGDSLHAAPGRHAAETYLRHTQAEVVIISGNHDLRWEKAKSRDLVRPGFYFHHGDNPAATFDADSIEIIGHHHPSLAWNDRGGTRLKLPALVASPRRLILPAFSPWAAGVPWNDRVLRDETLWAIGGSRIFPVKGEVFHPSEGKAGG